MSTRGRIDDFFSLSDFERQKKEVEDGIKEYIALVNGVPAIKAQVGNTDDLKKQSEATKQLTELQTKLAEATNKTVTALSKPIAGDNFGPLAERAVKAEIALKLLAEEKKNLDAAYQGGTATEQQYISGLAEIKDGQIAIQEQLKRTNAELRAQEQGFQAGEGSISAAKNSVKQLTAERDKLNITTEEGRIAAAEFNKEIDRQNEFIKDYCRRSGRSS
jgi:chromosome segregation ATPase